MGCFGEQRCLISQVCSPIKAKKTKQSPVEALCNMFLYVCFFFTKAFSMLANHVLSNMKIRKGEQRRDALLARLDVDTDQLLGEEKIYLTCKKNLQDSF